MRVVVLQLFTANAQKLLIPGTSTLTALANRDPRGTNYGSPAKSGGRTLFPIIKIGLYDCQGMLFRGSYSLLLVLYSTAVINLNCLLVFFFNSCFHVLLGSKGPKSPAQSSQVE